MADYGPSQAQQGLGALVSGLAGGYSAQRQAQNQAAMQQAYIQSLFGRQALKNQGATDVADIRGDTAQGVADTNAEAKKSVAAHKGGAYAPLRFQEDEAQRVADERARVAANIPQGQKLDFSQFTPEQATNYNTEYKNSYASAAREHNKNQKLRGYTDPQYLANENPADPITMGADKTVPSWFGLSSKTVPGTYAPTGAQAPVIAPGAAAPSAPAAPGVWKVKPAGT